jgi:hypothetical protein
MNQNVDELLAPVDLPDDGFLRDQIREIIERVMSDAQRRLTLIHNSVTGGEDVSTDGIVQDTIRAAGKMRETIRLWEQNYGPDARRTIEETIATEAELKTAQRQLTIQRAVAQGSTNTSRRYAEQIERVNITLDRMRIRIDALTTALETGQPALALVRAELAEIARAAGPDPYQATHWECGDQVMQHTCGNVVAVEIDRVTGNLPQSKICRRCGMRDLAEFRQLYVRTSPDTPTTEPAQGFCHTCGDPDPNLWHVSASCDIARRAYAELKLDTTQSENGDGRG